MRLAKLLIIVATLSSSCHSQKNFFSWTGYLDSSPIFIWYKKVDQDFAQGEILYLSTNERISIIGQINKSNEIRFYEFESDGSIRGLIQCKIVDGVINGLWISNDFNNEFPIVLYKSDTLSIKDNLIFSATNIAGVYSYKYDSDGPTGEVRINKLDRDSYSLKIVSVTKFPARNDAVLFAENIQLINNAFHYSESETCRVKVSIFKDFLSVEYIDNLNECEFGFNATVEGIYLKII